MANNPLEFQVRLHAVDGMGNDTKLSPQNSGADVVVGKLADDGALTLPGSAEDEILVTTLTNLRKYLSNLTNVAAEQRAIVSTLDSDSVTDLAAANTVKQLNDSLALTDQELDNLAKTVGDLQIDLQGSVPTDHSSETTTYGAGSDTKYGHVKLSDDYAADNSGTGAAANGIGASSYAVYRAYHAATEAASQAISDHANARGTSDAFGHVQLTDAYQAAEGVDNSAANSVAASGKALQDAYGALNAAMQLVSQGLEAINQAFETHKDSADHDDRYLSTDALNGKLEGFLPKTTKVLQTIAVQSTAAGTVAALSLENFTDTMAFNYAAGSITLNGTYLFLMKCKFSGISNVVRVFLDAYVNMTKSGEADAVDKPLIEAACDIKDYTTDFGGTVATSTNPATGIHTFDVDTVINSISLFVGIGLYKEGDTVGASISDAELYIIKIPV